MKKYEELISSLNGIKSLGFVKTHRSGNTGIGKTLEDLLGIDENNVPGPDGEMVELKSARKGSTSMLTLFTKSPLPAKANSILLQKFGYPSRRGNHKSELHTTVSALGFNNLKGKPGFKVDVCGDKVELVAAGEQRTVVGYWDRETLRASFERKLPRLLYVKAQAKGSGPEEEFWYDEAWLLSGFDFDNFVRLLEEGTILVDVRIGQYADGRPHDHGTGFRVRVDKLDLCFSHRGKVL
jgi:hypothetical protein